MMPAGDRGEARMKGRLTMMILAAGAALASPALAETPLFRVGGEQAAPGAFHPGGALLETALAGLDADDRQELRNCQVEKHTNGLGPFLTAARIRGPRQAPPRELYFVRGSVKPFCMALFGAHAFRWQLIEAHREPGGWRYRLVHSGGADRFAAYPTRHHDLYDIETTGCTAQECWSSRQAWDGHAYRPVRCTRTVYDNAGRATVTREACDNEVN
jgi:hypothetical protein